jgi:hypothetical protein
MDFDGKYFARFNFSRDQIEQNLANAFRGLDIANRADILDVKFNYAYTALIKGGMAILSHRQLKTKSIPGHQAKIIENMDQVLNDPSIEILGNLMRQRRNQDFYSGGIEVTEKECGEYLVFVRSVLGKIEKKIRHI